MNDFETLRLISLIDRVRGTFGDMMPMSDEEPVWNATSFLIRSEISGKLVTISTLCDVTGVPYATSRRLINRMINEGLILRTVRSRTGKSYALHPSPALLASFEAYGRKMKALIAQTIGKRSTDEDDDDYYFGGAQPTLPAAVGADPGERDDLRFLLNDDNYAFAVRNMWSDFRTNLGSTRDFKLMTCPNVHNELVENSKLPVSRYDVVGINLPWLGEFVERGALVPIGDMLEGTDLRETIHPDFWQAGRWRGRVYGVPIYATVNLLAARSDLFSAAEMAYPRTFDEVIAAGRKLASPSQGRYGVVWDAARGMPISHSFMFFMGAAGSPMLSLRKTFRGYTIDNLDFEDLIPTIDNDIGRSTLDFMHRLTEISPPDVLDLAWDDALHVFLTGQAAMSYCWSMRAARFEYDLRSAVKRRVSYLTHPTRTGSAGTVPIGGFLLAVPSNLPEDRRQSAIRAIEMMTSRETPKSCAPSGLPVSSNFRLSADPEMKAGSPVANFVDKWAAKGLLQTWQRPAIPQFHAIDTILGEEIHAALSRSKSDACALRDATLRMERALSKVVQFRAA
ncbi:MAG: extracellular solute-binding protein [Rhizobiaceae bacterium]|nr:extracellular solute-binding protein [Rhizobiaceae bacterium]